MKKLILGLGVILTAAVLTSCATSAKATESKETTPVKEVKVSTSPLGIDDEIYQNYLDKSFVSTGNNYRVKKFLEKLKNGDKVCVAALGGSVTEGAGPAKYTDGYAFQFNAKLKKAYAPAGSNNAFFDGAGLSGTPSMLGLIRYESDVVDVLGQNPDLLIIEFAVNDDGSSGNLRAFEQLIRHAYEANPETAVIALYSAATYGNQSVNMKPIADYYGVPQVNVLNLVKQALSSNLFKKEQYYTDTVHPTKEGHAIQADCIMNLIKKIDAEEICEPMAVPEKSYSKKPFEGFTRITGNNEDVQIEVGNFDDTDASTQSIKKTGKGNFPQNWHHKGGSNNFEMTINCKSLILVYKVQGSWLQQKFGKADIYVDGKYFATYDGGAAGGWCNCESRVIIDEETAAMHKVEVRMADGDSLKGFTIVAMGYSK